MALKKKAFKKTNSKDKKIHLSRIVLASLACGSFLCSVSSAYGAGYAAPDENMISAAIDDTGVSDEVLLADIQKLLDMSEENNEISHKTQQLLTQISMNQEPSAISSENVLLPEIDALEEKILFEEVADSRAYDSKFSPSGGVEGIYIKYFRPMEKSAENNIVKEDDVLPNVQEIVESSLAVDEAEIPAVEEIVETTQTVEPLVEGNEVAVIEDVLEDVPVAEEDEAALDVETADVVEGVIEEMSDDLSDEDIAGLREDLLENSIDFSEDIDADLHNEIVNSEDHMIMPIEDNGVAEESQVTAEEGDPEIEQFEDSVIQGVVDLAEEIEDDIQKEELAASEEKIEEVEINGHEKVENLEIETAPQDVAEEVELVELTEESSDITVVEDESETLVDEETPIDQLVANEVEKIEESVKQETDEQRTKEFLENIPANGIQTANQVFDLKEDISVEHGKFNSIFSKHDNEEEDPNLRKSVQLKIEVKEEGDGVYKQLVKAYNALVRGNYDDAILNYEKVLETDVSNEDAMFGLATVLHKKGELEAARTWYMNVLDVNHKNMQALNNLLVLISQISPAEALKELNKLERSNPEYAVIPAQKGFIYMQEKRYNEAARELKRATLLDPSNLDYRYNFALLAEYLGSYEVANKIYKVILNEGMKGHRTPVSKNEIINRMEDIASKIVSSN